MRKNMLKKSPPLDRWRQRPSSLNERAVFLKRMPLPKLGGDYSRSILTLTSLHHISTAPSKSSPRRRAGSPNSTSSNQMANSSRPPSPAHPLKGNDKLVRRGVLPPPAAGQSTLREISSVDLTAPSAHSVSVLAILHKAAPVQAMVFA